ncbi:MAG: PhoPQ-activated pathogenicity-related family protein [Acidobacteriota bacterium]
MIEARKRFAALAVLVLALTACSDEPAPLAAPEPQPSPLDVYVAAPDDAYTWEVVSETPGEGYTTFVIDLTSQSWLTEDEVDRTLWKHWLTIVRPDEIRSSHGLLFIGGGANGREAPTAANPLLVGPALATGTVTAELGQIPNQPISFVGDDFGPRVEDQLIAYGWDKYLRSPERSSAEPPADGIGSAKWLARLPMTKGAVRALDTITAFMASEAGGGATVDQFVVSGGSKRGWTTWTTAVVDERVIAIAPIVIDMLNSVPSFEHHYAAYGFWAPAVGDYEREGIMEWMRTPEYDELLAVTEPFSYLDRLTLPKMIINASGDQFFLPDSWQFYWDELQGEKHLRYVANADHSLDGSDAGVTLGAFYASVVAGTARPDYSWQQEGDQLVVQIDAANPPSSIQLWTATNEAARDFRVETFGENWLSTELTADEGGRVAVPLAPPANGWTARFVELTYGEPPAELKVTTGIFVSPLSLPFEVPARVAAAG